MEEYGHYAMMNAYKTGYFHEFLLRLSRRLADGNRPA